MFGAGCPACSPMSNLAHLNPPSYIVSRSDQAIPNRTGRQITRKFQHGVFLFRDPANATPQCPLALQQTGRQRVHNKSLKVWMPGLKSNLCIGTQHVHVIPRVKLHANAVPENLKITTEIHASLPTKTTHLVPTENDGLTPIRPAWIAMFRNPKGGPAPEWAGLQPQ